MPDAVRPERKIFIQSNATVFDTIIIICVINGNHINFSYIIITIIINICYYIILISMYDTCMCAIVSCSCVREQKILIEFRYVCIFFRSFVFDKLHRRRLFWYKYISSSFVFCIHSKWTHPYAAIISLFLIIIISIIEYLFKCSRIIIISDFGFWIILIIIIIYYSIYIEAFFISFVIHVLVAGYADAGTWNALSKGNVYMDV